MFVEFIQANLMWTAVAVISGSMLLWPLLTGASAAPQLGPAEATLKINREDAVVLDVRETSEWGGGHIAGARHITLGQLDQRLSEIDKFKNRTLIVCCASGQRSQEACVKLKKAGFEKAFSLRGGLSAWTDAGLPLTKKG